MSDSDSSSAPLVDVVKLAASLQRFADDLRLAAVVRDGQVVTSPHERDKNDKSIRGWKKLMKEQPALAQQDTDLIIKNTYRTLMTRGMKGCYLYCTDQETAQYFESRLAGTVTADGPAGRMSLSRIQPHKKT